MHNVSWHGYTVIDFISFLLDTWVFSNFFVISEDAAGNNMHTHHLINVLLEVKFLEVGCSVKGMCIYHFEKYCHSKGILRI